MTERDTDQGRERDEESGARMRVAMEEAGLSKGSLMALLAQYGDTRPPLTVARSIERMRAGTARVPAEMLALLGILRDHPEITR